DGQRTSEELDAFAERKLGRRAVGGHARDGQAVAVEHQLARAVVVDVETRGAGELLRVEVDGEIEGEMFDAGLLGAGKGVDVFHGCELRVASCELRVARLARNPQPATRNPQPSIPTSRATPACSPRSPAPAGSWPAARPRDARPALRSRRSAGATALRPASPRRRDSRGRTAAAPRARR